MKEGPVPQTVYSCIQEYVFLKQNIFYLISIGALTKGDRRAATGADLTEFNFDTPYGRSALRVMYQYTCMVSKELNYL